VASEDILLEFVVAARPPGGFASGLHGREQERDEDADDSDDDEQFNERKPARQTLLWHGYTSDKK
jgi:hypothetical protein